MSKQSNIASTPRSVAILGAGGRGRMFASLIDSTPHLGRVVAVAEIRDDYRKEAAQKFAIPPTHVFNTWQEFVARPKMADAVVIATMDRDHMVPAVKCMELGYDILLEKPMGVTLEECRRIEAAQRKAGCILGVCHSLRYQKNFRTLKDVVESGAIGRVMTIDHLEGVGFHHQVHSFVRGNWGNEGRSSFMLLSKSCHDIDFIAYLVGRECLSVASYGALSYFRPENAPAGSTERCTDPCPAEPTCQFSALKQYVYTNREKWWANVASHDHSLQAHLAAVKTGPYGRCAWKCDNDVVDHQVVAMQFADDITATFTMTAFGEGRRTRVHGTKGCVDFTKDGLSITDFATQNVQSIKIAPEQGAHGGGDARVAREWLHALHSRDDSQIVANAQESLRTHSIVFAAEKARREGRIVKLAEM